MSVVIIKSERGIALTQEDLANLIEIPAEDLDDQLVREKYIDLEPSTEEEVIQTDLLGYDFMSLLILPLV